MHLARSPLWRRLSGARYPKDQWLRPASCDKRYRQRQTLGHDGHGTILRAHRRRVDEALDGRNNVVVPVGGCALQQLIQSGFQAEAAEKVALGERARRQGWAEL